MARERPTASRFVPRPARRLLRAWQLEQRTLRQGFVALLISSGGDLLAGLALGSMTGTLERLPGLLILVPGAIGMRGDILGALGSRLGTTIHAGTFRPSVKDRDGPLFQNVVAAFALSLATALFLGVIARAVSLAFGLTSISTADFVAISILGGLLGTLIVGGATVGLSLLSHRRGWDMDTVSAPLVTAAGDVVTLPALWLASSIAGIRGVTITVAVILASVSILLAVRAVISKLPVVRRIVRESLPVLLLAGVLHILAGAILENQLARFQALPALLVLIPPFLEDTGALGGMLSSRLASKLHLGLITPTLRPGPMALVDVSINALLAVSVFLFLGISAWAVSHAIGLAGPGLGMMVAVSMVAGAIATVLSSIVAYLAAVATFRFGLDPDNHGIPIVTSCMDFLGAATLVGTITLFGLGAAAAVAR
jgi:mgtE-like transporter